MSTLLKYPIAFLTLLFCSIAAWAAMVEPGQMGTGALLLRSTQPGKYVEAPRLATDFDITVTGPIARTRVTQQFTNPTDGWVEGIYVFPLPENSAVDTLRMVIGNRAIVGEIKERKEAQAIYDKAKAEGKKAALMAQDRPNLFTNAVANIGPNETVVIQIEYQETVRQSSGSFSLRVPTVAAPRYAPGPTVQVSLDSMGEAQIVQVDEPDPAPQPPVLDPRKNAPVNPVTLTVHLRPGFETGEIKSATHALKIDEAGETVSVAGAVFADRDFELTWAPKAGPAPSVGLFHERVGDADYLLSYVTPPAPSDAAQDLPREAILVIDNSGSMGGPSMSQAKASVIYALDRLDRQDRFNVIRFDDTMEMLFEKPVAATPENIATAKRFTAALEATGGTEMIPPMRAALDDRDPESRSHVRQVIFMTDGEVTNERQLFETIAALRGRSRVFMVGIGSAPNSYLMTRAAELGRGTYTHVSTGEQVEERMREMLGKLESPVVSDLAAEFSTGAVTTTPGMLPDVYRGEPVMFLARMPAKNGTLKVMGSIAGKPWATIVDLGQSKAGSGISKLWARRMIADAEVSAVTGGASRDEADKAILALALKHGLVSSQTSLIAVDKMPERKPGVPLARADIPLNLPAGWDYDKVFGEKVKLREAGIDVKDIKLGKTAKSETSSQAMETVDLPEGATPSWLLTVLGFIALLLGLVLAFLTRKEARA